MKVRKGFIYALLLAVGLLLWTEVADAWQEMKDVPQPTAMTQSSTKEVVTPWTNTEAIHTCGIKAKEFLVEIQTVQYSIENQQGHMDVVGKKEALKKFYRWLENEGKLQDIVSVSFETMDEQQAKLSVQYHLPSK